MDGLQDPELNIEIPSDLLDDPDPVGSSVRRLGRALMAAAIRIEREMADGQVMFKHGKERQTAHALLGKINDLLPLLEKYPAPPDPDMRFIPRCPVCCADPGQHWAHECPLVVDRPPGMEATYDYRKNDWIFYSQIKKYTDPPDPREVFVCAVCRGRWTGEQQNDLVERGHDFGEQEMRDGFDEYEKKAKK